MSLIDHHELEYVRDVARHWYRHHSAIDEPEAQERAMQWETVLLAESPEDLSKALDQVALGILETNEQQGEADG